MKILITGKNGQLGSELNDLAKINDKHTYLFTDVDDMDLSDTTSILNVLNEFQPELIVSAGAYTAVDKAETDQDLADTINHLAVKTMGEWAKKNQAKIIHISTDYVFDGNSSEPLKEDETPNPINVYGKTKFLGEEALKNSGAEYVIIRTAWVYSTYGANFVKTMIRLMNERDTLSVVSDQIGSPTYAKDLAKAIMTIIDAEKFLSGIFHFSNEGKISWFEFASAIKEIKNLKCTLQPIESSAFPTPAKRPNFSLLDKTKIKHTYQIQIPNWKDSLEAMLHDLN